MLKKTLTIGAAIILAACATPTTKTIQYQGRKVVMHIDHDTAPICGVRGPQAGCSDTVVLWGVVLISIIAGWIA